MRESAGSVHLLRIAQAARLRDGLIARHGEDGAFPAPHTLPGSTWIFQAV